MKLKFIKGRIMASEFNLMAPINLQNLLNFLVFSINSKKIFFPKSKKELEDILRISFASYLRFQEINSNQTTNKVIALPPLIFYASLEEYLNEYQKNFKIPEELEKFIDKTYNFEYKYKTNFNELIRFFVFKLLLEKKNLTDELNILFEINKSLRDESTEENDNQFKIETEII